MSRQWCLHFERPSGGDLCACCGKEEHLHEDSVRARYAHLLEDNQRQYGLIKELKEQLAAYADLAAVAREVLRRWCEPGRMSTQNDRVLVGCIGIDRLRASLERVDKAERAGGGA